MNKYLKQLLDALAAKQAEKQGIVTKALDGGQTPNEEEEKQIDAIDAEIATIQKNIDRVQDMIKQAEQAAKTATPAAGANSQQAKNSAEGDPNPDAPAIVIETLPKGIGFAQFVRAKMLAAHELKKGNPISAVQAAKTLGFSENVQQFIEKATLGTTTDAGFAAPLVDTNTYTGDFIELLRNATVFDKLKGFRSVPFNVKIKGQATGGTAAWVGEGEAKPLTNPTFESIEIKSHKLAAITVYTQELLRRADPAIDSLVLNDLIAASAELVDATFLGAGAETDTTPAGILNGVTAVPSTGTTAADYEADLMSLITGFVAANLSTDNSYFLMSETRAMQIALLRDALGNAYFAGMSFAGAARSLLGIPVITSQAVGDKIELVKMSELLIAQDGGVDVSYSDQATLVDGTTTYNLWQNNEFAVRVEKFITWKKRRAIASAYIQY